MVSSDPHTRHHVVVATCPTRLTCGVGNGACTRSVGLIRLSQYTVRLWLSGRDRGQRGAVQACRNRSLQSPDACSMGNMGPCSRSQQTPCLLLVSLLLCWSTWCFMAAARQQASCHLRIQGYGYGMRDGIRYASLNCSTSDGGLLPIGINQTYLGLHATNFYGVKIMDSMPCLPSPQGWPAWNAQVIYALLYVCGDYDIVLVAPVIHSVWFDMGVGTQLDRNNTVWQASVLKIASGVSATVLNGTFVGVSNGSVIVLVNASVNVLSSEFRDCVGFEGSAVAAYHHSSVTLTNSTFDHNNALAMGGAIFASGSINVSNCTFSRNGAPIGGAVMLQDAVGILYDTVFIANGCNISSGVAPTVTVVFSSSQTAWNIPAGGALHSDTLSTILTSLCSFLHNYCSFHYENDDTEYGHGGAMFIRGAASISQCHYTNNSAMSGGAVFILDSRDTLIANSAHRYDITNTFHDNSADSGGAVASSTCSDIYYDSCEFYRNDAASGSAVFDYGSAGACQSQYVRTITIHTSMFINNTGNWTVGAPAIDNSSICVSGPVDCCTALHIISTTISGSNGSGVVLELFSGLPPALRNNGSGGGLRVIDSSVCSNFGGGIIVSASPQPGTADASVPIHIMGATNITNNQRSCGGGIYAMSARLEVIPPSQVMANRATEQGGGVCLMNSSFNVSQIQKAVRYNDAPINKDVYVPGTTLQSLSNCSGTNGEVDISRLTDDGACFVMWNITGQGGFPVEGLGFIATAMPNGGGPNHSFANTSAADGGLTILLRLPLGSYMTSLVQLSDPYTKIHPVTFPVVLKTCREGQVVSDTTGGICQLCPGGSYSFNQGGECQPCPATATCPGGALILPQTGYWHSTRSSPQIHRCPNLVACQQASAQDFQRASNNCRVDLTQPHSLRSSVACSDVRLLASTRSSSGDNGTYSIMLCSKGYHGHLCGSCNASASYALTKPFHCQLCGGSPAVVIGLLVVAGVMLLVLIKALCYFTLRENARGGSADPGDQLQATAILKPFVLYLQYILIVGSLNIDWPAPFAYPMHALSALFSSASGGTLSIGCVLSSTEKLPAATKQTVFYLVMPFVMMFALLLLECIIHAWIIRSKPGRSSLQQLPLPGNQAARGIRFGDRLFSNAIVVLFFFLPSLARTTFSLFACVRVDSPGHGVSAAAIGNFWLSDMSQQCYGGYHKPWALALGVPMVFLICIALPFSIFYIVLSNRHRLSGDAAFRRHYGFLYKNYRHVCCYWEGVIVLQTLSLVAVSVFGYNLGAYAQSLVMLAGLTLIQSLLIWAKPYAQRSTLLIMTQGIACAWLTTFVALTLWPDAYVSDYAPPEGYRNVVAAMLLLVNVAYIVSVAWKLVRLVNWRDLLAAAQRLTCNAWDVTVGFAKSLWPA